MKTRVSLKDLVNNCSCCKSKNYSNSLMKFKKELIEAHNDTYSFLFLFDKFHKIITFSTVPRIKTMVCRPFFELWFLSNNLEKKTFLLRDASDCKTFYKMADADDFARGETLDIFLGMLDGSDHLFEGEIDNIRH